LTTDWILDQFGASRPEAQKAYRKFVSEGRGVTVWESLRGQIYLGSDEFIEDHAAEGTAKLREVPKAQRLVSRPPLAAIVSDAKDSSDIAQAYTAHGYSMD
jgi:putative transposase